MAGSVETKPADGFTIRPEKAAIIEEIRRSFYQDSIGVPNRGHQIFEPDDFNEAEWEAIYNPNLPLSTEGTTHPLSETLHEMVDHIHVSRPHLPEFHMPHPHLSHHRGSS